jgi:hypothetical protein
MRRRQNGADRSRRGRVSPELVTLLSQRVLQHWPAMGSTRQSIYWLAALRQDQNPQACTRAMIGMFQEQSVSALKRAALEEEESSAAQQARNLTPSPRRQAQLKRWLHPQPPLNTHVRMWVPMPTMTQAQLWTKISPEEVPIAGDGNSICRPFDNFCQGAVLSSTG